MAKTQTAGAGSAADACTVVQLAHLDIDPMNVRRTDLEPSPDFVANIAAEGVQQPLLVRPIGNTAMLFVFEGGKRMRALRKLREAGVSIKGVPVTDDYLVPVVVKDLKDQQAKDMSLAMNLHRSGMHPVDKFEAFAELITGGETAASIAVRHGMTERAVTQALALGALSTKIREAWRTGTVDAQTAQAFTLASTHAMQDKVFAKLLKENRLHKHQVHSELKVSDDETGQLMAYVGAEAYVAAGGKVTQDLFSTTTAIVSDPPLLKQLAGDMLAKECDRLVVDEGWAWALIKPQHFFGARDKVKPEYTPAETERLEAIDKRIAIIDAADDGPEMLSDAMYDEGALLRAERETLVAAGEMRGAPAKFRKTHGCLIFVSDDGRLRVEVGYKEMPKKRAATVGGEAAPALSGPAAAAASKATAKQREKRAAAGTVSNALAQRLSEALTAAAESVMRTSPKLAPIALIAGALSGHKAVDVRINGLALKQRRTSPHASFVNMLEALLKAPADEVANELAGVAAAALDFQEFNGDSAMKRKETAALVNALDGPKMRIAIRKAWDAADYFGNVSADIRVNAVRESLGEDRAREVGKMKKDQATKWCTTNVPPTGWVPPQLRVESYEGPKVAKTSAKAAPAKPAKKNAKAAKKAKKK